MPFANHLAALSSACTPRRKTVRNRRALALLGAAITLVDCTTIVRATTQTSTWTGASNANWNNAANWSPANSYPTNNNGGISDYDVIIPSVTTEPSLNISSTIDALTLNSNATLGILGGNTLVVLDAITDNGTVNVDSNNTGSSTLFTEGGTISGTGNIVLDAAGATIFGGLIQASGHTISGYGQLSASITNNGIVDANFSGQTMTFMEEGQNNGIMEATNHGTLFLNEALLSQASGGQLSAAGGTVILGNDTTITGGALNTSSGGAISIASSSSSTLNGVTNNGTLNVPGKSQLETDAGFANNGDIIINSDGAGGSSIMLNSTVSGTGAITLVGGALNATIYGAFTQASGHTINGSGLIEASMTNNGTVNASVAGGTLGIEIEQITNGSLMESTAGTLFFEGGAVINTGGTIDAVGNNVIFQGSLTGGTVKSMSPYAILAENASFSGVTVAANSTVDIPGNNTFTFSGATNTDNGNIVTNYDNEAVTSTVQVSVTSTLSGSGTLTLGLSNGGTVLNTSANLTITAGITSSGPGVLTKTGDGSLIISGPANFATGTALAITAGTVDVTTGGSVVANGAIQDVAASYAQNGILQVQGTGSFSTDGAIILADGGGMGTLIVQDNATVSASSLMVARGANSFAAEGLVNQMGGTITVGGVLIASQNSAASGTYSLGGGVLSTASIYGGLGNSTFNFGGGTLQATADNLNFISGITSLAILGGGAIIDTNGHNDTIAEKINAADGITGGLTKNGAGTLTITAAATYTGATAVNGGDLKLVGFTVPSSAASIASGGILEYDESVRTYQGPITYTGGGTLRETGPGQLVFGANGTVDVDFSKGALIDVEQGELYGSSGYGGSWTANQASMNVAAGAAFDAVEAGSTGMMQIDALTGAGAFSGGFFYNNNSTTTVTLGIAGGSGTFSGSLQNDSASYLAIVKTGAGTETLTGTNFYSGGTTVNAGVLVFGAASALPNASVSLTSTGKMQLAPGIGGTTIQALSISGSGTLDIENNHLFINYGGGTDPIASIAAWIKSGYASGAWTGSGITSSAAEANSASYGIGFADSADSGNPAGLPANTIEIKYTLLGDANLDGSVNSIDFAILASNFNKSVTSWDQGDFNYDHAVNSIDFAALASNFNKGAAQADDLSALEAFASANGLLADVPEPASIGILSVIGLGLVARRRRNSFTGHPTI